MTVDDRDALDALNDRLRCAEATLQFLIEHDRSEIVPIIDGVRISLEDALRELKQLFEASPAQPPS